MLEAAQADKEILRTRDEYFPAAGLAVEDQISRVIQGRAWTYKVPTTTALSQNRGYVGYL